MWLSVVVIILCLVATINAENSLHPLVETKLGKIHGSVLKTVRGHDIYSFRGVRYAKSPTEENRFKEPTPIESWGNSEYDATKDGYICPQWKLRHELMSEDCLVLNVYSRNLTGNTDVMVYIHGGGNVVGSSHSEYRSGPEYLLDHNIVLVTINYRLGALGFLSTQTKEAKGNYGYLDQVLALKWVREHIKNFGGNPSSVTLFGLSAGGMAVTLHMASPLSAGLFHKAIAISGSATSHYHVDNVRWTQKLARSTGCPMYNPKDLIECLRKIPWKTIIAVCSTWEPYGFPNMKWKYEVDGHFLTRTPTDTFAQGLFHKVPLIAGITKDEFTFVVYKQENNTGLLNDISLNFDKYAPELFELHPTDSNSIADIITKFYLNNQKITPGNLLDFGRIFADSIIAHGVHRLVHLARRYINVYYYQLDYVGTFSYAVDSDGKPRGVYHADDESYMFMNKEANYIIKPADPDIVIVDRITTLWTSFAKNGAPERISNVEWVPSNATAVRTMFINKELRVDSEPFTERFSLWDTLFPIKSTLI